MNYEIITAPEGDEELIASVAPIAASALTLKNETTDTKRLDWLGADNTRLEDVRGRMNNEEETIREAIDALTKAEGR